MKLLLIVFSFIAITLVVGLFVWRQIDHHADRIEMDRLRALQPLKPAIYTGSMVSDLPEPARRYFAFAIAEGTPLYTVGQIDMTGQLSLGSKDAPNYMKMSATQVLAAPEGFVWKMAGGAGLMQMSGSDTGRWTRFWMAGLAPVARFGGDNDHKRSAFGRYASEAAFWTPAAILPGPQVTWEAVDANTARYTMTTDAITQSVDLTVDADGQPVAVVFPRWSNANPQGIYRLQPFGGVLSDFRDVQGFRVPFHVEAGNLFGTEAYFPFFIANVSAVQFPVSGR